MALIDLTPVFTLEQARAAGLRKDEIYDLLAAEEIERVGRGVYLCPGMLDERFVSLASATAVRSEATMCLTSALAHHDRTPTPSPALHPRDSPAEGPSHRRCLEYLRPP